MRSLLKALCLLVALGLTACATNLEKTYEGPVARVADSADKTRDAGIFVPGKANMFYLLEMDGERVPRTNFSATAARYSGGGIAFEPVQVDREVPARPLKVKLRGSTYHAAPIGAIFGKSHSVEGVVDFAPVPDGRYVVRGKLGANGSSIWIETVNGQVVTQKVYGQAR